MKMSEYLRFSGVFDVISGNELKIQQEFKKFSGRIYSKAWFPLNYAETETFPAINNSREHLHFSFSGLVSVPVCASRFNHSNWNYLHNPSSCLFSRQSWNIMYLFAREINNNERKENDVQSWKLFIYHFLSSLCLSAPLKVATSVIRHFCSSFAVFLTPHPKNFPFRWISLVFSRQLCGRWRTQIATRKLQRSRRKSFSCFPKSQKIKVDR